MNEQVLVALCVTGWKSRLWLPRRARVAFLYNIISNRDGVVVVGRDGRVDVACRVLYRYRYVVRSASPPICAMPNAARCQDCGMHPALRRTRRRWPERQWIRLARIYLPTYTPTLTLTSTQDSKLQMNRPGWSLLASH